MSAEATPRRAGEGGVRVALPTVAYVGAVLPKRSETFVYREVLGLRARGHGVVAASLRPAAAAEFHDDAALRALAEEAVVAYGDGWAGRGLSEALRRPGRAARAGWRLVTAGLVSRDLGLRGWTKLPAQWWGGLALASSLRGRNVGHLHAHMAHAPATVAMVAADALGVAFSFTGHAADLFRDRALLRAKLRRAAFVACISEWHRGWYRQVEPALPDARLPVIRCGVNLDEFSPGDGAGRPAAGGVVVLAVGRLVAKKGFDVLLRAWAAWLSRHGYLRSAGVDQSDHPEQTYPEHPYDGSTAQASGPMCVIMGDGPEGDTLRRLANDLDLGEHVSFTGAANQEQVRVAMRDCDVFALPCRPASDGDRDGIPVVMMEAMACGKPVVGGDLAAIRELLTDNSGARRVEPGNEVMLEQALEELLGDADARAEAGRRGRMRVAEEFSDGVNLDRLEKELESVTHGSEPRGRSDHG